MDEMENAISTSFDFDINELERFRTIKINEFCFKSEKLYKLGFLKESEEMKLNTKLWEKKSLEVIAWDLIYDSTYSYFNKFDDKKENEEIYSICSIWVTHEEHSDNTFDINVWDEIENERYDELEKSSFTTLEDAKLELNNIVKNNPEITFVKMEDEIN